MRRVRQPPPDPHPTFSLRWHVWQVLREFVELCFAEKLIKLVFATETLAVGVNMPARTVVFSQLDKPNDGDKPGHRSLRPDEFWQMAGRAGRRGMDELGCVRRAC